GGTGLQTACPLHLDPERAGRRPRESHGSADMFFFTYLRRELRRRMRQAIFIAVGLALGIGLVVTVTAASAGVRKAQSQVLKSLYGVGTDVTVTGKAPKPPSRVSGPPKNGQTFMVGPGGAQVCTNGKCHHAAGRSIDPLDSSSYTPISQWEGAAIARLKDVKAVAGGLALSDPSIPIPKHSGQAGGPLPTPASFSVQGTDTSHASLGPL